MTRQEALELRRKKRALIALWNRLAKELRGSQADDNVTNLQKAGRLLEACQDKQGLFETRVRKFLNQGWRTYRRLGDLLKAWETLGDSSTAVRQSEPQIDSRSTAVPEGPNWRGYWKPPPGWDDPRNVSPEVFKAKLREIRLSLRA